MSVLEPDVIFMLWNESSRPCQCQYVDVPASRVQFRTNFYSEQYKQFVIDQLTNVISIFQINDQRAGCVRRPKANVPQEPDVHSISIIPPRLTTEDMKKKRNRENKNSSKQEKRYTIYFLVDLLTKVIAQKNIPLGLKIVLKARGSWGEKLTLPVKVILEYSGTDPEILRIKREMEDEVVIYDVPQKMTYICNLLYELAEHLDIKIELSGHRGRIPRNPKISGKRILECYWNGHSYNNAEIIWLGKEIYEKQMKNYPNLVI